MPLKTSLTSYSEGWAWHGEFTMTDELLTAFSQLTGDLNAMHMDSTTARAYPYRQRVAHGMLSVSALLLSTPLADGKNVIKKLSGRFNNPVFVNDLVTIDLAWLASDTLTATQSFSYTIRTSSVKDIAAYGEIALAPGQSENGSEKPSRSLVTTPLAENALELAQITRCLSENFSFIVAPDLLNQWINLLKSRGHFSSLPDEKITPSAELAATLLTSTLVGMRLPGRLATFLDFAFSFPAPLAPLTAYELKGTVDYISAANQIIIENVRIYVKNTTQNPAPLMQGKVTVKMNEPSQAAPAMQDLNTDMGLKGKTVLITGASRGIGATTARLFACYGANVIVNYHQSQTAAEAVVKDINTAGPGRALAIKADVSQREEVKALFAQARQAFGPVDILVNNAVGDFIPIAFPALTWDRLQQDLEVVVKGAFNCCQEAIPGMIQNKGGRIINVITIATETPPLNQAKYVIAKSALVGLTRSLAVEMAAHNILANMVLPGMVETDLTKTIAPAIREKIKNHIPLARHTSTVDVAKAIVTLASALTPYTTGQKILVTGGLPPFI
ncbi:MAG: SDR family oxidoreductase [Candidatus Omnitrophica bacterium]|nr:SDR family oxidoreductase [Candidatus Omnitrophota bacterium]